MLTSMPWMVLLELSKFGPAVAEDRRRAELACAEREFRKAEERARVKSSAANLRQVNPCCQPAGA